MDRDAGSKTNGLGWGEGWYPVCMCVQVSCMGQTVKLYKTGMFLLVLSIKWEPFQHWGHQAAMG